LKTIDAIVAFAASHEIAPRPLPVAVPVDVPPSLPTVQHMINGACVTVRPMGAADFALEADFIRGLSAEARYKRFMTTVSELPKSKMTYLTDVDQRRHVALVATVERDGKPDPVGVVRYVLDAAGTSCEFAIALDDDFQHTGLAGILMRMLIDIARSRGLATMEGLVLATNRSMLKFTRQLGFSQQHEPDDYSTVRVALAL
jgi:acetyltransferase